MKDIEGEEEEDLEREEVEEELGLLQHNFNSHTYALTEVQLEGESSAIESNLVNKFYAYTELVEFFLINPPECGNSLMNFSL